MPLRCKMCGKLLIFHNSSQTVCRKCLASSESITGIISRLKQMLNSNQCTDSAPLARFIDTLELCNEFETDLVEMTAHMDACDECRKYQGRIYSITGSNTNFPKLPSKVLTYGVIHNGCRHAFGPYIEGSPPVWSEEDLSKL